jgi:hypothetical protein
MGNYRFQLNAESVDINPVSSHHICLTIDINEDKIDDLLQEMPIEKILNHLGADVLNANLFLKYCTLEDVFEHFNPAELKNKLAQYLLEL